MPWLTGTAFLHSVMIQEKRGLLKHWNMILIILTYALVIFGTFLTRSGVLSSVHAFAQSAIGPPSSCYWCHLRCPSIALVIYRWPELRRRDRDEVHALARGAVPAQQSALHERPGGLFLGRDLPADLRTLHRPESDRGPPFYERATAPLFAALMLLMGVAPLSAWGHSDSQDTGTRHVEICACGAGHHCSFVSTYTQNFIALDWVLSGRARSAGHIAGILARQQAHAEKRRAKTSFQRFGD